MILTSSASYWSTGIILTWTEGRGMPGAWSGKVEFFDDGFANNDPDAGRISTEGELHTRYPVRYGQAVNGLTAAIDVLIADAAKLGITFRATSDRVPCLYYRGDGEDDDYPPPKGWRQLLADQATRIGWATYNVKPDEAGS